jgi:hypothetical protein
VPGLQVRDVSSGIECGVEDQGEAGAEQGDFGGVVMDLPSRPRTPAGRGPAEGPVGIGVRAADDGGEVAPVGEFGDADQAGDLVGTEVGVVGGR